MSCRTDECMSFASRPRYTREGLTEDVCRSKTVGTMTPDTNNSVRHHGQPAYVRRDNKSREQNSTERSPEKRARNVAIGSVEPRQRVRLDLHELATPRVRALEAGDEVCARGTEDLAVAFEVVPGGSLRTMTSVCAPSAATNGDD